MDFRALRKEYENAGIRRADLASDPIEQFKRWFDEATKFRPGEWCEPNAMALATSDAEGRVSVRYVLLKGIEANGIQFFTSYESQKGQQLAANPKAAVVLHWPYLGRQVRIEGTTEKTNREVSEAYFRTRPRGSQMSGAFSPQSKVVASREQLQLSRDEFAASVGDDDVPLPETWGGYLLKAERWEFWQGRSDRLHDRIVYQTGEDGSWLQDRLAP